MNTTETIETEPLRESVLAARMNIPRSALKQWRDAGQLLEGVHWLKEASGAYVITPAGIVIVMALLKLPVEETTTIAPRTVTMVALIAGVTPRVLRCRPADGSGGMVSVRLTGPNVFAAKFRRGDRIEAVPTETDGIFEYDGPAPRRMVL